MLLNKEQNINQLKHSILHSKKYKPEVLMLVLRDEQHVSHRAGKIFGRSDPMLSAHVERAVVPPTRCTTSDAFA